MVSTCLYAVQPSVHTGDSSCGVEFLTDGEGGSLLSHMYDKDLRQTGQGLSTLTTRLCTLVTAADTLLSKSSIV